MATLLAKIIWKQNMILIAQYQSIISCLPQEWKTKMQNVQNLEDLIILPECKTYYLEIKKHVSAT